MSKRHRRPCPTATKAAYPDRIAADLALAHIVAEHGRAPVSDRVPIRSYLCACGRWHLTSREASYAETQARMDAEKAERLEAMRRIQSASERKSR